MILSLSWQAARSRFFSVSLVTVVVSAIIVRNQWQAPAWLYLLAVLVGALLVHAGSNLWNDYADELNGSDRANLSPSPFNGGSRVIQRELMPAGLVRLAAVICFGTALAVALLLVPQRGWLLPALTVAGIALSLAYSSPPAWLSGRGLGELSVALCFGPLLGEGTALVLTGRFSRPVFWAAIPLGLLVAAILTLNEIPDLPADVAAGKKTLPVRRGWPAAIALYRLLVLGAFLVFAGAVLWRGLPARSAWALAAGPGAAWVCRRAGTVGSRVDAAFLRVAASTILLHLSFGLLLAIGLW